MTEVYIVRLLEWEAQIIEGTYSTFDKAQERAKVIAAQEAQEAKRTRTSRSPVEIIRVPIDVEGDGKQIWIRS